MRYLFALLAIAPVVLLVVGAIAGRVQVRACCPAPEDDLRMAAAFREDADPETRAI